MSKALIPYVVFFATFFAAAVPMLYYYQRKNPNPRFRPTFGEMSLVTLIAIMICGGMAYGLGSMFKPENDGSSFKKHADEGAGWSAGGWNEKKERDHQDSKKKGSKTSEDD